MALAFALLELRSYKEQMTAVQEMLEVGDEPYPYYSDDEPDDEDRDEEGEGPGLGSSNAAAAGQDKRQ